MQLLAPLLNLIVAHADTILFLGFLVWLVRELKTARHEAGMTHYRLAVANTLSSLEIAISDFPQASLTFHFVRRQLEAQGVAFSEGAVHLYTESLRQLQTQMEKKIMGISDE